MKGVLSIAIALFVLVGVGARLATAASQPSKPMPAVTPAFIEEGRLIYFRRCSFCHGLLGDGNGPAADFLDPRPRDFTLGTFKFRTTQSGELPLDVDLFRTVSRGLGGTAMQSFDKDLIKNGLSEDQRWAVIAYIKTFAFEFEDEELDPVTRGKVVALPAKRAPFDADTIAKGKKVFERAKCWECHGKLGRADGQQSFDREGDGGFPIRIRNVTHPWKIKAGVEVEDIYMRFSTGINGTPMPSFVKALSEEERWYLANYIKSLQHEMTQHQVLKVLPAQSAVPDAPDDPMWVQAEPMDLRLTGQVVAAPRWQNASIELVTVKAIYDENDIAFLVEWDDPFKDVSHDAEQELDVGELRKVGNFNSYVAANDMVPRQLETFRDAIALQFPTKLREGTRKPHFMRGGSSQAGHVWRRKADLDAAGDRAVEEAMARGWKQPPKVQAQEQQQIDSKAVWDQGRWRVVMKRPRFTEDKSDVQFVAGKFIPMSMNAWDGSNGEHGLIMSLSTWHYVLIETPTPMNVYVYAVLAALAAGALGYWLVRQAEQEAGGKA